MSRWTNWLMGLLVAIMVGCSPAMLGSIGGLIGLGGDKPAIESEIRVAGEANDSIVVGENERTDIKAETVNITEIINKNFSWPLMIIAMVGWAAPTPSRMVKWTWAKLQERLIRKPRGLSKNSNTDT